jgi:hypothetical protein
MRNEQRTANSEQRTANSEQYDANVKAIAKLLGEKILYWSDPSNCKLIAENTHKAAWQLQYYRDMKIMFDNQTPNRFLGHLRLGVLKYQKIVNRVNQIHTTNRSDPTKPASPQFSEVKFPYEKIRAMEEILNLVKDE